MDELLDCHWEQLEAWYFWNDADRARIVELSKSIGLDPWTLSILDSMWYGHGSAHSTVILGRNAFGRYASNFPDLAHRAISRSFREGLVHFLLPPFIREIRSELESANYLMPQGLIGERDARDEDLVGSISFTRIGATQYMEWLSLCFPRASNDHWCCDGEFGESGFVYATTAEACHEGVSGSDDLRTGQPVPVGRWCDRWWNRFETGYRMRYWHRGTGQESTWKTE